MTSGEIRGQMGSVLLPPLRHTVRFPNVNRPLGTGTANGTLGLYPFLYTFLLPQEQIGTDFNLPLHPLSSQAATISNGWRNVGAKSKACCKMPEVTFPKGILYNSGKALRPGCIFLLSYFFSKALLEGLSVARFWNSTLSPARPSSP